MMNQVKMMKFLILFLIVQCFAFDDFIGNTMYENECFKSDVINIISLTTWSENGDGYYLTISSNDYHQNLSPNKNGTLKYIESLPNDKYEICIKAIAENQSVDYVIFFYESNDNDILLYFIAGFASSCLVLTFISMVCVVIYFTVEAKQIEI